MGTNASVLHQNCSKSSPIYSTKRVYCLRCGQKRFDQFDLIQSDVDEIDLTSNQEDENEIENTSISVPYLKHDYVDISIISNRTAQRYF